MNLSNLGKAAAALALALAAGCAAPREALPLRVGLSPTYPPICMTDGSKPVGLEVDFAQALAAELQVPLDLQPVEFDELFPALLQGKIDIAMAGLTVTPARSRTVAFCRPYMKNPLVAATRPAEVENYADAADVLAAATSIGVMRGSSAETFVQRHCGAARVVHVTMRKDVAPNLASRRISLYVDDLASVLSLSARHPDAIRLVPHPLFEQELAWAVNPDNIALREACNAVLDRWERNGRLQAMLDHWLPAQPAAPEP